MAIDAETAREQRRSATKPTPKADIPKPPKGGSGLTKKELKGLQSATSDFNKAAQSFIDAYQSGAFSGDSSAAAAASAASSNQALIDAMKAQQAADERARQLEAQLRADEAKAARQSAYDLLFQEFSQYGLGGLVEDLKGFIVEGLSPAEFTLKLRATKAYQNRFAANQQRIAKGLRALSEAEYIGLEDGYQEIMRRYGMPESYYAQSVDPVTGVKTQKGFEKFIAGDVSTTELEDRIQTAYNRVINANPEVTASLKSYYPDITNGDILAYALDPEQAIGNIKRKVTAAEIGGAAAMAGLTAGRARAEELGAFGVTSEQARQGFRAVAEVAPRGGQLAEFYRQTPYTQTTAEQEVFGLAGATEAERQRKKLTQLEQASFAGQAGIAGGAIARDRAGAF